MEVIVVLGTLAVLAAVVGIRWYEKRNAPPERRVVPATPKVPQTPKPPETENDRLIRALTTMDQRAAERMDSLKWFLFWLPFIWSVIWGIVYWIILSLR